MLRTYHDQIADIYDQATARSEFKWEAPAVIKTLLVSVLGEKKRASILDIGIGTGQASEYFYKKGFRITGIDISPEMIGIARKKFPRAKLYSTNIEQNFPPLRLNTFDAVMASGVFEFIANLEKVIEWTQCLLKHNGYLCFTFDEYIPRSMHQRWKVAPVGKGFVNPIPKKLSFLIYRRTLHAIKIVLAEHGFRILKQSRFVAYAKGKKRKVPVMYRAILAQKI